MKKIQAFVFIELMFVVVIIGVLAAVSLPAYQRYVMRAQVAEALLASSEVRAAVNEFYRATGRFPKDNKEAGLAKPQAYRGNYFVSITVEQGAVNIELDIDSFAKSKGRWLSLRPLDIDSALLDLAWVCGYTSREKRGLVAVGVNITDIDSGYLPSTCQ